MTRWESPPPPDSFSTMYIQPDLFILTPKETGYSHFGEIELERLWIWGHQVLHGKGLNLQTKHRLLSKSLLNFPQLAPRTRIIRVISHYIPPIQQEIGDLSQDKLISLTEKTYRVNCSVMSASLQPHRL